MKVKRSKCRGLRSKDREKFLARCSPAGSDNVYTNELPGNETTNEQDANCKRNANWAPGKTFDLCMCTQNASSLSFVRFAKLGFRRSENFIVGGGAYRCSSDLQVPRTHSKTFWCHSSQVKSINTVCLED